VENRFLDAETRTVTFSVADILKIFLERNTAD